MKRTSGFGHISLVPILIVLVNFCVILFGCQRSDRQDSEALKQSFGRGGMSTDAKQSAPNTADRNEKEVNRPEVKRNNPPTLDENASKEERMLAIRMTLTEADWEGVDGILHPKEAAILVEGMDVLSAAKYLVEVGHEGAAYEYMERAVAENPGNFEALLLKTYWTKDDTEKEAGYRNLLEMDPDSVEVLYRLGEVLNYNHPEESIVHLQKAISLSPKHSSALFQLSASYELIGQLDKALAAAEKSYEINPHFTTKLHIQAIKRNIEKRKNQPPDVQAEATKSSVAPVLDGSSPSPEKTEAPVDKTTADESPTISPPAARDDKRRVEARQAMEAEFEKLLAEYERMIRGESAPADSVNRTISDLKRSIESSPNRSDSYLELGRAYEKAGDDKKAAEVYRQARKRFPKDKRFQRTLKKGPRRGSESDRNRRKITKLTNRKARVVIEYVFNLISAR